MSGISPGELEILHMTQAIRGELLSVLSDSDLAYKLPGDNPSLGELCRENGQVEVSYIASFKTFKQNFTYPAVDPALAASVEKLKAWYAQLDAELEATLAGLADTDMQNTFVERGFPMPLGVQFHTYREALLIFYAKATCYLKGLGKTLPRQMSEWIG